MTLNDIINLVRRRAGDIDPAAYRYTKNQIVVILDDARRALKVRKVTTTVYTVVTTTNSESITPEPTDDEGVILALQTAVDLLWNTYRGRVDRGELGVLWRSGLEEQSSIAAERAYKLMIQAIESELERTMLIVASGSAGTRPQ